MRRVDDHERIKQACDRLAHILVHYIKLATEPCADDYDLSEMHVEIVGEIESFADEILDEMKDPSDG